MDETRDYDDELDDIPFEIVGTLADAAREYVEESEESAHIYLRESWLSGAIATMYRARWAADLTQAEVAERLGTTQSAIARLERADDTTLRRLWEYLYARRSRHLVENALLRTKSPRSSMKTRNRIRHRNGALCLRRVCGHLDAGIADCDEESFPLFDCYIVVELDEFHFCLQAVDRLCFSHIKKEPSRSPLKSASVTRGKEACKITEILVVRNDNKPINVGSDHEKLIWSLR
jgi:hypothetical protein